jgi:hypothetical protein
MSEIRKEIEVAIMKGYDKKLKKILKGPFVERDETLLETLRRTIEDEKVNGIVLNEVAKAYFRIKRKNLNDCTPLFELWHIDQITIQESLLEVLGYDRVVPTFEEQKAIIDKYFYFGTHTDYRYCSDPRYGLAAACAGWDSSIVESFLKNCLTIPDAPLKYVSENSLKKKYVRLR